jgi:hypothetical protein
VAGEQPAYPGQPGYPPQGPPPGYPAAPYGAYPPASPVKKKGRGRVFVMLALLLALSVGAAAVILTRDDDTGTSVGQSIRLEPITTLGLDPFSEDNLDLEEFTGPLSIALADFPVLGEEVGSALAGRVSKGSAPGLYGGSQNVAVCDVDKLIEFLTNPDNSAKAEAWAATLDIEVSGITDYVRGLTPVRLRFDTRVTNHGFKDGKATKVQSLLQAGTGVLVDNKGVPRVKCNCGNPLLEPAPLGEVPGDEEDKTLDVSYVASNPEDAWPDLAANKAVSVEAGDEVGVFTLVDLETGRLFQREIGTDVKEDTFVRVGDEELCETLGDSPTCAVGELGSGDVQVTLQWGSQADLDLHVFEPDGTEIWFNNKGPTASGGTLDLDSNEECAPGPAAENVFWGSGAAPPGEYTVVVHGYDFTQDDGTPCGSGEFTLTITVAGEVQTFDGTVGQDEDQEFSFQA